jgi:hypothetical protein
VGLDLALRLWRQGYDAIPAARGWSAGRDAFVTRMLGRRALVVRGEEGARPFYDSGLVRRRKALMMRVLAPDRVDELVRMYGAAVTYAAGTVGCACGLVLS